MGESVSEGTVLEWHAAEGDQVSADETLVEVSTDKVDAEVPSPASGTLVKIHVQEGDTISVGAVLCEISPNGGSSNGAGPAASDASNGATAPDAPAEEKVIDVAIPAMGESVTEGVI